MPNWVIEGLIATSPRPGYRPGPEVTVADGVVDAWLAETLDFGIASVICLIGGDQLWLYRKAVPEGLIARYQSAGLAVYHIPVVDQQTNPFSAAQYEAAWHAFQRLPKPVLVHCSAGMDRTGRIVEYLRARLNASTDTAAAGE